MDLNRHIADSSVLPNRCILLAPDFQNTAGLASVKVVYSGPLNGVTEDLLQQAKITLVHPGTLAAIKAKLDQMGAGTPIEEIEACDHDWAEGPGLAHVCLKCGVPGPA